MKKNNFRGNLQELKKLSKKKKIKSVFEIVVLVIKSYSKIFRIKKLENLLIIIDSDCKYLINYLKKFYWNRNVILNYHNILIMNKFVYYSLQLKLLENNKSKFMPIIYSDLYIKFKSKFRKYGSIFFKNNRKLNKVVKDDFLNKAISKNNILF